jgi:hypothetical protein
MDAQRLTRREVLQVSALLVAGGGIFGCGRRAPTFAPTTSSIPVWDSVAAADQGPGPRSRHCLAYDPGAKACVLFSGLSWDQDKPYSDTWELRDTQWFRVESPDSPPPRQRGAMVFDSRRGQCVLFGGQGRRGITWPMFGDTWTYAERRWRQWDAGSGPRLEPRCGNALAFDEEAGAVVLFGGIALGDRSLGDTWLFDGTSWKEVSGPTPPARRYAAFAFDPDLKGCVLHGGSEDDAGRRGFGDTWLFRDRTWTKLANVVNTPNRDDHGLAYHRAAKRLVMFGGLGGKHGVLVLQEKGWQPVEAQNLPPRFQCSPLAWDDGLGGLVFYGGEARHGGPQFQTTWLLRASAAADAKPESFEFVKI